MYVSQVMRFEILSHMIVSNRLL